MIRPGCSFGIAFVVLALAISLFVASATADESLGVDVVCLFDPETEEIREGRPGEGGLVILPTVWPHGFLGFDWPLEPGKRAGLVIHCPTARSMRWQIAVARVPRLLDDLAALFDQAEPPEFEHLRRAVHFAEGRARMVTLSSRCLCTQFGR